MRRGNNNGFVRDQTGVLVAINLGADFTAEHEWGIGGIGRAFGIDSEKMGIDRYLVTRVPDLIDVFDRGKVRGFVFGVGAVREKLPTKMVVQMAEEYREDFELSTAWDGSSFAALTTNVDVAKNLTAILEALRAKNAVIMLGGGGVFQNAGLVIGIADRIPQDIRNNWLQVHREQKQLADDFAATGIEERLRAAGLRWFSLRPRRLENGEIRVWLNPMEQHAFNSNWFTIADLDEWAKGRGPVVKAKAGSGATSRR